MRIIEAAHWPTPEPLAVWRLITDCSVNEPFNSDFVMQVSQLLLQNGVHPGCNLLDLGAGFGNPSVGLAKSGYRITAVESDLNMVEQLERCSSPNLTIEPRSWLHVLPTTPSLSFDAVLILGNALLYQETWPASPWPGGEWRRLLIQTLQEIARVVRPGGLLVSELSVEAPVNGRWTLSVRRYRHSQAESTWLVDCDFLSRSRIIDTLVHSVKGKRQDVVHAYARYQGILVLRDEVGDLLQQSGWYPIHIGMGLRDPFVTVIAATAKSS